MWHHKYGCSVFLLTLVFSCWVVHNTSAQSSSRCKIKRYTHKAVQTDLNGLRCWDDVKIKSCWGYCLSYEVLFRAQVIYREFMLYAIINIFY